MQNTTFLSDCMDTDSHFFYCMSYRNPHMDIQGATKEHQIRT